MTFTPHDARVRAAPDVRRRAGGGAGGGVFELGLRRSSVGANRDTFTDEMALRKKGSRTLVVDDVRYRWVSDLPDDALRAEERVVSFVVQAADVAGARMRACVHWMTVVRAYRAVGKGASKKYDRAPPFVIAQAIRLAIGQGWKNDATGPEHDAGMIDALIDWSALTAED